MDLFGLDGCKHGAWVLAGRDATFEVLTDLRPLFDQAARGAARIVMDVPIGLITTGRACDMEARPLLPQRRSSVFTPPSRAALAASTRQEASRLNEMACGRKIGCQSFGILPRIRAVDQLITPTLQKRVHEGHPEVSFAVIAGASMAFRKKDEQGRAERLRVLKSVGIAFDLEAVRRQLTGKGVSRDDILDAAVMLATAMRIEKGIARRLPSATQERDERGLLAEMWA